jgi:hypothetical protein
MNTKLIFAALIGAGLVLCIGFLIFFIFGRKNNNKEEDAETFNENRVEDILKEDEVSKEPEKKEIKIIGDKYKVLGNEDEYIISFNAGFDFLVKNDEIIGFIAREKSNKIYYYHNLKEGEENV